ncbi:MAG TPA: hypothetical protein VK509_16750, partial [Polyangiales bacterium]|nr:hypothetical protein [Polyangiales bacterium]
QRTRLVGLVHLGSGGRAARARAERDANRNQEKFTAKAPKTPNCRISLFSVVGALAVNASSRARSGH